MKKETKKPVTVDELSEFKAKLEKLLLKYPNLPEFTLTIRPRIDIKLPVSGIYTWQGAIGTLPLYPHAPSITEDFTVVNPVVTSTTSTPEQKSDIVDHPAKSFEAGLSKKKIEEIERMSKSGNGF